MRKQTLSPASIYRQLDLNVSDRRVTVIGDISRLMDRDKVPTLDWPHAVRRRHTMHTAGIISNCNARRALVLFHFCSHFSWPIVCRKADPRRDGFPLAWSIDAGKETALCGGALHRTGNVSQLSRSLRRVAPRLRRINYRLHASCEEYQLVYCRLFVGVVVAFVFVCQVCHNV